MYMNIDMWLIGWFWNRRDIVSGMEILMFDTKFKWK